ncbi:MAG: glycosyltransferase [Pseudomonadota bacterium]
MPPKHDVTAGATVAAVMIVRDEERFLERCLNSISAHVTQTVIVDTGSNDSSIDIANSFGCTIVQKPWEGDFAKARNHAFEHTDADWCLYIDADERLLVPQGMSLGQSLDDAEAAAFFVRFIPKLNFTPYHEIRLFRNDPRIRFRGNMHESAHDAIREVCLSDGLAIKPLDVLIEHHGYEGDPARKYDRNLPLLKQATKEQPERAFIWTHLGETLAGLGKIDEAREAFGEAIRLSSDSSNQKQRVDGSTAWAQLLRLEVEHDPVTAVALGRQAWKSYPGQHAIALQFASALLRNGEISQAIPILEGLEAVDAESFFDPLAAYDKRIFGEWSNALLGDAHFMSGDKEKASLAYGRATALAPDVQEYRVKAALCS